MSSASFRRALVGAALLGATAAGGAFAASAVSGDGSTTSDTSSESASAIVAVDDGSTTTSPAADTATDDTATDDERPAKGPHEANGITEEPLTGDALTQATNAALAAVPGGTVVRAETDADGAAYEVHMTNADGDHVTVKLNADFTVAEIVEGSR